MVDLVYLSKVKDMVDWTHVSGKSIYIVVDGPRPFLTPTVPGPVCCKKLSGGQEESAISLSQRKNTQIHPISGISFTEVRGSSLDIMSKA